MKKKYWYLLFAMVLMGELAGILIENRQIQYFFKPLIIMVVIGYFDSQLVSITKGISKWILAALIFSLLGDVLLLLEDKNSIFFLLGLSSFLIAHVFYIIFFHHVRVKENVKSKGWLLFPVIAYYAGLMIWLSPYLGDMMLPVRIYGIIISFMILLALHMLVIKNKIAGRWMVAGALLFVISDTVLAINKFYASFEGAGIIIMLTYGLAQLFIIEGAARHIRSVGSN